MDRRERFLIQQIIGLANDALRKLKEGEDAEAEIEAMNDLYEKLDKLEKEVNYGEA